MTYSIHEACQKKREKNGVALVGWYISRDDTQVTRSCVIQVTKAGLPSRFNSSNSIGGTFTFPFVALLIPTFILRYIYWQSHLSTNIATPTWGKLQTYRLEVPSMLVSNHSFGVWHQQLTCVQSRVWASMSGSAVEDEYQMLPRFVPICIYLVVRLISKLRKDDITSSYKINDMSRPVPMTCLINHSTLPQTIHHKKNPSHW